jgi:transcriptional regulator with XRE-family HTH domain
VTTALRDELADFLRRRRAALSPAAADLPAGVRRRTPGLRRDEVAHLANMSANYYERLERGCAPQPSPTILAGLADALRLLPEEREYLYRLCGHAAPPPPLNGDADHELVAVMAALDATSPAFICDDIATVVAQNPLHVALFGSIAGLAGLKRNMIWRWFCLPHARFAAGPADIIEGTGRGYVADLRRILAQRHHDSTVVALVSDLRERSAEFRELWAEHRVSAPSCPTVSLEDDRVGRLEFWCAVVMSPNSSQRLAIFRAVEGTPTRQRLAGLASDQLTEAPHAVSRQDC